MEEHNSTDSNAVCAVDISELVAELEDLAEKVEKSMRGDILCQKCSDDLGFGYLPRELERNLLGGYKCLLCTECVNRWTEHLNTGIGNNAYARFCAVKKEVDVVRNCYITTGGDKIADALKELKPLYALVAAVEKELYTLGKEWIADKLPVPAATGVTP